MPDIYTHILAGRESLKNIETLERESILYFDKLFYLGCMGPDIFLYHNSFSRIANREAIGLGRMMHRKDCGNLITNALKYIKETSDVDTFSDKRVIYLLGYLCHYAADRIAHPYVFYRSGIYQKGRKETYKFRRYHKIIELAIDSQMAKYLDNGDINIIKMYELIDVGKRIPDEIENLYEHICSIYFKGHTEKLRKDLVNKSYTSMKKAWSIFYDPNYIKRYLLKQIGLNIFIYPVDCNDRDYMNEKKEKWFDPWSCKESNKTFFEIFNEIVELSSALLTAAIAYLDNKLSFDIVKEIIGNYSLITNTDASEVIKEAKCFKLIF